MVKKIEDTIDFEKWDKMADDPELSAPGRKRDLKSIKAKIVPANQNFVPFNHVTPYDKFKMQFPNLGRVMDRVNEGRWRVSGVTSRLETTLNRGTLVADVLEIIERQRKLPVPLQKVRKIASHQPGRAAWKALGPISAGVQFYGGIKDYYRASLYDDMYVSAYYNNRGKWKMATAPLSAAPALGTLFGGVTGYMADGVGKLGSNDVGRVAIAGTAPRYSKYIARSIRNGDLERRDIQRLQQERPFALKQVGDSLGIPIPKEKSKPVQTLSMQKHKGNEARTKKRRRYNSAAHSAHMPNRTIARYKPAASKMRPKPISKSISTMYSFVTRIALKRRTAKAHFAGGIVSGGAQLISVAEEGTPEMIIPLGTHRRQRGVELWERAGRMMGINQEAKKRGSLTPKIKIPAATNVGAREQDIMKTVYQNIGILAEDVAGVFDTEISGQYANTPK